MFEEINSEEKRKLIINEVLTTPEAIELLGISRSRMSAMIRTNKIKPVKS
jgi:predicted XRE-type DNA-binding protein